MHIIQKILIINISKHMAKHNKWAKYKMNVNKTRVLLTIVL